MGNVAYIVLLFGTLDNFIPGISPAAPRCGRRRASIVLWLLHFPDPCRGVQTAAFINVVVTIAKVVPILTFIGIAIVGFRAGIFSADSGDATRDRRGTAGQHGGPGPAT